MLQTAQTLASCFPAFSDFSNIKPELAERRVSASALAYGGDGGDDLGGDGVPPWIANPNQLVSWWDMFKFSAAKYFHIASTLQMWAIHNENNLRPVDSDDGEVLPHIRQSCEELGLRLSSKYIVETMLPKFTDGKIPTNEDFTEMVDILNGRIFDELELQLFLYVPPEKEEFYEQKTPLFGVEVIDKFPTAIGDIQEAGKCLALGRGTACVFHMMRVVEVGLRSLAKGLDIPYAPSWESYLRQIETKMAEKHNKKSRSWKRDEPFYRDASGDLQAVKIAWRNPTMHIVRSYTPEQAEDVLRTVRTFMQRLATRFTEKGPIKFNEK